MQDDDFTSRDSRDAIDDPTAIAKALRESERRFAAAFHAMPYSISVSELATGRYVDCNAAFERVSGYRRDEVVGRTSFELNLWVDPQDRDALVRGIKEDGKVRDLEVRFRAKGGRIVVALCHCDLIEVAGVPCFLNTFEDLSDRLRVNDELRVAEAARRRAAAEFQLVFESSPIGLALFDSSGRPYRFNPSFERFFGHSADALRVRTIEGLEHPDDLEPIGARFHAVMDGRIDEHRVEKPFLRADGSATWGRMTLTLARSETEGQSYVFCMIEDTNERRRAEAERARLEAQLRQTQKLDALGTLAGGIAHDFNNILTATMTFTDLAIAEAEDPAAVRSHLAQVNLASARAQSLVRGILAFSRRQQQERRPTSIVETVREALRLLESSIPKLVRFDVDLHEDTPRVLADATQIHQVVMNLCTNASHAIGDRAGTITVRVERVQKVVASVLGVAPSRAYARLTVSDDGAGMDEATLPQVFDPFFTTKAPGMGTGLGLSVVHGIVTDHEGTIELESRLGVGTTFRITFPECESSANPPTGADLEVPRGRGEHVLLVDDEVQVTEAARLGLTRLGFRVTTFNDPGEALARFVASPSAFDVVITDFAMPMMSGVDLARGILDVRKETPVILISGYSDVWTDEAIRDLGLRELVNKPVSFSALARSIRRALDT